MHMHDDLYENQLKTVPVELLGSQDQGLQLSEEWVLRL